jgi:hypothetical protein
MRKIVAARRIARLPELKILPALRSVLPNVLKKVGACTCPIVSLRPWPWPVRAFWLSLPLWRSRQAGGGPRKIGGSTRPKVAYTASRCGRCGSWPISRRCMPARPTGRSRSSSIPSRTPPTIQPRLARSSRLASIPTRPRSLSWSRVKCTLTSKASSRSPRHAARWSTS